MAFMADLDFRPDVYQIKQLNNVLVAHPNASMTSWAQSAAPDRAFP
jgi:hypothetical protein